MKGFSAVFLSCLGWWLASFSLVCEAEERLIYQTGFETAQGFNDRFELIGQNDWTGQGTGGNGLELGGFPGKGYQAYVGYYPPTDTNIFTSVWRPIDLSETDAAQGVLKFSVTMQIVASTNSNQDNFRWSVYNTNGTRLFSLDFETATRNISYVLDDGRFVFTNLRFDFNGSYDLVVYLNFALNHWMGTLNDVVIVDSRPITTKSSSLSLGDVDAVWEVRAPGSPGNNYMLFDDYRVAQTQAPAIPPFLEPISLQKTGEFLLRVHGEEGIKYDVDVTEDFSHWFNIGGLTIPTGGSLDFQDTTSPGHKRGFYRALLVP